MTDEKYVRGQNLLESSRDAAVMEMESDFLKVLLTNGYQVTNLASNSYQAAMFNTAVINPAAAFNRGITIHSAAPSPIKKLHIHTVSVCPVESVDVAVLTIRDNNLDHSYNVQLVGGQVNTFQLDFTAAGNEVRITLDNTNLQTYNAAITCMKGCNGTVPNPCGWVAGWNGTSEVKTEGFGISATFSCDCDYSQLLCAWAKQFTGEIVYWKARSLVMQERLNSERLNNFVVYNREEAQEKVTEFENTYRDKWNTFALALPGLLKNLRDDCIICNKPHKAVNV